MLEDATRTGQRIPLFTTERWYSWAKPNAMGILIWLALVATDIHVFQGVGHGDGPSISSDIRIYGIPSVARVDTYYTYGGAYKGTDSSIRWLNVLYLALLTYFPGAFLGHLIRRALRRHGIRVALILPALASLGIGFVVSVLLSQLLWGFWLFPPPLDKRVNEIVRITSISGFYINESDGSFKQEFEDGKDGMLAKMTPTGLLSRPGPTSGFARRALTVICPLITEENALPPVKPELLQEAFELLYSDKPHANLLSNSSHGQYHAYAFTGKDQSGRELLFIDASTQVESYSHREICLECLFALNEGVSMKLLSSRHIYAEWMGRELFVWQRMTIMLFWPIALVLFPLSVFWARRQHSGGRSGLDGRGRPIEQ